MEIPKLKTLIAAGTIWVLTFVVAGAALAGNITGTVKVRGMRSPANILVYLTKAPRVEIAGTGEEIAKDQKNLIAKDQEDLIEMDQKDLTFRPHILPIPVGTTVSFPNNDKVDHNVFSMSRTQKFNLGSYKPGESKTVRFDKPGIVELRCDVHAEMLAYVAVMKNPYFAVTDAKGRFTIPDPALLQKRGLENVPELPAGKYFVKAWHAKVKTKRQSVQVPGEGSVAIKLNLTRGTPGVLYK